MVELMVALAISTLLLAGVVQVFTGSRESNLLQEGNSRLQENARFSLSRLSEDIGGAGYLGCLESAMPVRPFKNDLALKAPGSGYDFATPLFGTDNTGPNGSDTIGIRRTGSSAGIPFATYMDDQDSDIQLNPLNGAYASLQQFDILVVGDCGGASVFMITNDPTTSGGTIQHASGVTASSGPNSGQSNVTGALGDRYGADQASVAGAYRVGTTTYLLCPSISGNGTSLFINACGTPANELVEGVEDMQFLYGVDTDTTAGADEYVTAAAVTAANQWNSVVSVRMTLTFNSVGNVPGGALVRPFTTTVRLRNRGG